VKENFSMKCRHSSVKVLSPCRLYVDIRLESLVSSLALVLFIFNDGVLYSYACLRRVVLCHCYVVLSVDHDKLINKLRLEFIDVTCFGYV
jgi:hypothetical protein